MDGSEFRRLRDLPGKCIIGDIRLAQRSDISAAWEAKDILITNADGAWCKNASEVTCYAPEWTVLNYTNRQLKSHDFISFRNEFFDDLRGQRTGYKDRYFETGISWNHWIGSTVVLRPELRWEHAFDNPAFFRVPGGESDPGDPASLEGEGEAFVGGETDDFDAIDEDDEARGL